MERTRWSRATACAIAILTLVWIGVAAEAQDIPCGSCVTLTVSGAGASEINGTYTYDGIVSNPDFLAGTLVWLGPSWDLIPSLDGHWGLLRVPGPYWICGVIVIVDHGETQVFISTDSYYTNPSTSRCPPETDWVCGSSSTTPAPTISRAGCLCAGIGDLNGDDDISAIDARMIFAHASGCSLLSGEWLERADIDDDGDVDEDDARLLAELLIGICP